LAAQLSSSELLELAQDKSKPDDIRAQLAGEAWYQAVFAGGVAQETAAAALWAELTGNQAELSACQAGKLEEARYLMARALLLDQVRRLNNNVHAGDGNAAQWKAGPAFHDAAQQAAQLAVARKLTGANDTAWMGKQILPWLTAQPKFAEAPAILEKLVRATRYFHNDTATSRAAFQLLHKQYPKSAEAARTKYYY
jgi:hypothetical protein